MTDITGTGNRLVVDTTKLHQKKYRSETGLFLLEGYKPIQEAFSAGVKINTVFVTEGHIQKYNFIQSKIKTVSEAVMKKISTTDSPAEAVAVAVQKVYDISDFKDLNRIALIENIKDAGNLGTIIRSACAFGIDGIVLCGECIDLYNPKVVRSTAGNLFKLPVVKIPSVFEARSLMEEKTFIATVVDGSDIVAPEKIDFSKQYVLMLGSEADGLSNEAIQLADIKTTIKISSAVESLNLSIAASVLFYIAGNKNYVL